MSSKTNQEMLLDLSRADGNILLDPAFTERLNLTPENIASLPDRNAYVQLKDMIGVYYGRTGDEVVLGNGSDELIDHIARARNGKTSLTLVPSFERLYEVNAKFGYDTHTFSLREENRYGYDDEFHAVFLSKVGELRPDLVWLCSPNNPTGTIIEPRYISEMAASLKESWIVIDTAFMDIADHGMTVRYAAMISEHENIVLLNSFSKSCGLAKVRIGFLLTNGSLASEISRQNVMFNVNGIALELAKSCLEDHRYQESEIRRVQYHLDLIRDALKTAPQYELIANADINLFTLKHRSLPHLHQLLSDQHIKTKSLDRMLGLQDKGYCRILVPREERDVSWLLEVLSITS